MESKYLHLKIDLSGGRKLSYNSGVSYSIKKLLVSNPFTYRVVGRIGREFRDLEYLKNVHLKSFELVNEHAPDGVEFDSPYGYQDEVNELSTAIKYKNQLEAGVENFASESGVLYRHAEQVLTKLLSRDANIKCFVNFAVSYGYINSLLAPKFPNVKFIGINGSKFTRLLNEESFAHLKNMEFVAGDVFRLFDEREFDGGVLFHARTLTLLPNKPFIERLYKTAAKRKLKYVVGMELIGISRQTGRAYEFSDEDPPSVAYRGGMFIHNYPGILKNARFLLLRSELVKTDHPHEDFRILSFTAHSSPSTG
jgi:hypothetical protein